MRLTFGATRETHYAQPHHLPDWENLPHASKHDLPQFGVFHHLQLQDAIDSRQPVAYLLAKGWTHDMIYGALGVSPLSGSNYPAHNSGSSALGHFGD